MIDEAEAYHDLGVEADHNFVEEVRVVLPSLDHLVGLDLRLLHSLQAGGFQDPPWNKYCTGDHTFPLF